MKAHPKYEECSQHDTYDLQHDYVKGHIYVWYNGNYKGNS